MFLSNENLKMWVQELLSAEIEVVAPSLDEAQRLDYRKVDAFDRIALDGGMPARSLKEFFLPPTEPLFFYRQGKQEVELVQAPRATRKRVILGAKPCDAAALPVVDKVMDWDYHDQPWFDRRENTTIVALACQGIDRSCFCAAVDLHPGSATGSDLVLTPVDGGFAVKVETDKGKALTQAHASRFESTAMDQAAQRFQETAREKVEKNLKASVKEIHDWLDKHFEDSFWDGIALRCHGCGACASVCPTCHCFDIVDEPEGVGFGVRRRNWDTCQTAKFTLHGSGHNPRADQNVRIRQRLMHKFSIYPERFNQILCTGCGRCARACPGGMDLPEVLGGLAERACQG